MDKRRSDHFTLTMQDRAVNVRGNRLASKPSNFKDPGPESLLKLMIDGMDQAKFLLPRPRGLLGTSSFSQAWRPSQHVTGLIAFGAIEAYYVMSPDCAKDSNMNSTLVAHTLDLLLGMGKQLPQHLLIAADNTPRESKNSHFAQFCAFLTAKLFTSCEVQFMQAGHTKNELDQRFSTVAAAINRADCLESPEDLVEWMRKEVQPAQGRHLVVELVQNTQDFRQFFYQTGVQMSGLTATKMAPNTNHVWRFTRRSTLNMPVECEHEAWKEEEPHQDDICCVFKQYMSSPVMSQAPILMLPARVWQGLRQEQLLPSRRNAWPSNTLAEFRKTAKLVAAYPWQLFKAQQWLEQLCNDNEGNLVDAPIQLEAIWTNAARSEVEKPAEEQAPAPAPAPPRKVTVRQPKAAELKKRAEKTAVMKRPSAAVIDDVMKRPASKQQKKGKQKPSPHGQLQGVSFSHAAHMKLSG